MFSARLDGLEACDVCCLQALGSRGDLEFDRLSFVEGSIAVPLNCREMDEDVFTGLTLDESESLACIEPLNCSLFFHSNSCSLFLGYLVPPDCLKRSKKRGCKCGPGAP